ncbi:hypothetical protein LTS07_004987 [Exophiala sideris]|uniref:Xylanolytic transcriptional activator regulatory domain-containing protein n=1 Tax=Exophiala sideris TaxID=1016849 RepID=A0ABR0JC39_9EURO|nr:hypothetical protein LTS07_004987 [Exophiala sideris]KAK5038972.1 hypothetical protein LTR13_004003 [Exophiala sideris]KAK5060857.1 hypothetical protein LTR69_005456 [Exophiala sideris]KAK5183768.1 hypothetical protein LTR44_004050 [Eurotiomycetes sp. CCFEE 6388]
MEALLESSVTAKSTPPPNHVEPEPAQKSPPASLEKEVSNLVINDAGEQKFIGSSSGLSLFSPRGLAWVQRKLGSDKMVAIFRKFQQGSPMWPSFRFGHQLNEPSDIYPFPPREIALYLVDCFFKTFNAVYPLFSRDTFWELFERQYSDNPPPQRSWISALSIVLSIGCSLATDAVLNNITMVNPSFTSNLMDLAWKYFKNASSIVPTLLFTQYDLLMVQTLIGMAYVMQTQMHPEGAFLLIGIAARVSSSLGLHRHLEGFGLSESESYQRQRVFWILYVIDKDMSIRIGRPSAIDDDDAEIEIVSQPSQGEISIPTSTGERGNFYPFQSLCSLALIQSRIFHELYAAKARNNTTAERLESISKLDAELHDWKEQIPSEIRPENPIHCDKEYRHSVLQLHYSYYHCLTAIHRVNAHHELWASEDTEQPDSQKSTPSSGPHAEDEGSKHRTQSSYALCLMSARSSLLLTASYLDEYDIRNKLIWLAPYFPVTSFLALFTHILHNPLDSRADADLALMVQTIISLHKLVGTDDRSLFSFITNVLDDCIQVAKQHVQDSRAKSPPQNSVAGVVGGVSMGTPSQPQFTTGQQAVFNMPASSISLPTQVSANTLAMGQQPLNAANTFAVPQAFEPTYQPDFDFNNVDFTTQLANQGQYDTQGMMSMDDPFLLLEYGEWDWTY